jgi:DNA-binding MarR family transcriptional regulator
VRSLLHAYGLERERLRTALARAAGLTTKDLDALEHLELAGPLTQRELADRLLLSTGGVTVLVDRLERGGWVRRTKHPSDRRAVLLELSPRLPTEGLDVLEEHHRTLDRASRGLSVAERTAVANFLQTAAASARTATESLGRVTTRRENVR